MKKQHFIVLVALLTVGTILNASRFYSIISVNGNYIKGYDGYLLMQECFPMIQQSSSHGSGWGLAYYIDGSYGDQFLQQSGELFDGPLWRSQFRANTESNVITNIFNQIRFVDGSTPISGFIGHIRKASSGCGSTGIGDETTLPNPHPFIQGLPDGKTYSFAHNGTFNPTMKITLRELITIEWMITNNFIPQTYDDIDGCGGDWQGTGWTSVVDSELFFFWIIKNIMNDPAMDITRGIQKALNNETFRVMDANKNFVLTDGEAIWSFRKTASDDDAGNPNLAHTVYWKYINDGDIHFASAISQKSDPLDETWHWLNNRALVYLPSKGKPVVIENFDMLEGIELKRLHKGTNWVGFPVLDNNIGTPTEDAVYYLTNTNINLTTLLNLEIQNQAAVSYWESSAGWQQLDLTNLESIEGYKLTLADNVYTNFYMPVAGDRIDDETEVSLQTGLNWVSYFPVNNLAPSIALPQEVRDNLKSIRGENWFMICRNGEFYVKGECIVAEDVYAECYTLVYGDMYVLDMSAPVTFQWITSPFHQNPFIPEEPQSFTVVKTADYIPVVIDTIESVDPIIEIGAIKNGVIVGAEVVNGYPVNFKLYSDDLEGVSFEVVTTQNGAARQSNEIKMKPVKQEFDRGAVFMTLSPEQNNKQSVPKTFSLVHAYPNPFNPRVTVQFNLIDRVQLSLIIYDITGKRIKTIMDGRINAGLHSFTWDGTNEYSNPVATGIYIYQLQTQDAVIRNKIIYLK